jgi:hypothetical protein
MSKKVLFRKWKDTGEIIAFLTGYECRPDNIMSYEHVGQHGEASRDLILELLPASPDEYQALLDELKSLGYELEVVERVEELD